VLTVLRRAVMIPLVVGIEVLLLVTSPLSLAIAAVAGIASRSTRPVRTVALVLAYAAIELGVLCRISRTPPDRWDVLLRDVLSVAYRVLHAVLDVDVTLEDGSVSRERLATTGRPVIVLARHCGPGDSLFIAWLLAVHYGLRLRVVLKSALRLDPAVDLAGGHLPLCFVGAGGRRARRRISRLTGSMTAGDAFLLFPEGGNFSWPRWRQALEALAEASNELAARAMRRHTHTLPPHRGGTTAALTGAPDADVMLLAHAAFTPDGRDRPWWRLPVHRSLLIRTTLLPAADVPRDRAAIGDWLTDMWSDVDDWVADRAPSAAAPSLR
jgi:1-acyl-sn-glycerol-3-phosphate acyltransferase